MLSIAKLARLAGLIIFAMGTHVWAVSSEVLQRFPVPPGTQISEVSEESIHNGASVSIATYQSALSLDDTLAFYQNAWSKSEHSTLPTRLESVVGNWLLISRLENGFNTVIQLNVSETLRSTGFISVMAVSSYSPNTTDIQHQNGYQALATSSSQDGAVSSTLTVLQSNQSLSAFRDLLVSQRISQGWQLSSQRPHAGSHIVLMSRRQQRVELVISQESQGTVIAVVNEVSNAN